MTGSANQRPNTPCIQLWIDVTFRGLENSYTNKNLLEMGMHICVLHLNILRHEICKCSSLFEWSRHGQKR